MNEKEKDSETVGVFFWAYVWLKRDGSPKDSNEAFLKRMKIREEDILYSSEFTNTLILRINTETIETFLTDSAFEGWSPYDFEVPKKSGYDAIIPQINALSIISEEIEGDVKIGVISAENNTFDKDAISLKGLDITTLPSPLPPKVSPHPTAVLSEIVGRLVEVDGTTLSGLARGASAFFYSAKTAKNVYQAIEKMLSLGVRVINYSAGIVTEGYSPFDMQIDRLIEAGNFLFVCSSGNDGVLTSPAKAENALACGNVVTKDYPNTPLSPPWSVWCPSPDSCSGFGYTPTLVHKPDVVAPGAFVGYGDRVGANFESFGTSFACPWVSAVAARIIGITNGKYTYLTVKGIILLSASNDRITRDNNPPVSDGILEKSGFGMIDVERALDVAKSAVIYEGRLTGNETLDLPPIWEKLIFIYEKSGDEPIISFGKEEYSTAGQNAVVIKREGSKENSPLSLSGNSGTRFSVVAV